MNPWYWSLIQSIDRLGEGMVRLQQKYQDHPAESPETAQQIRQASTDIQDALQRLRGLLQEVAQKTDRGIPAAWDLVAVVPADEGNPEQAEHSGELPEVEHLSQAFEQGMDGFYRMKELIKTHSRLGKEERLGWAEQVEELGKEFHRMYQLARDAHDANWYDTYD
ncbi:MAG: hypothetical protein BAA01_13600 [Bacillus thermozeamaize]|jgi:hypothetical protein|uniref:Uncharacterized protein n=1 Tax=Bacillus thermozeamaize TaxID=230954 RepID=A0A1Y3PL18_9BACI|nr:MAG: hypothetical protein BAA01_13600 [Bacillus thermozeamaize]